MSMEILESRIAPAGVVTIEVSGGVLELTGDDAGAEIIIEQISPKTFQITGVGTQLQGPDGLTSELIVSKVTSINATFGPGEDILEIHDATLKSLSLNLGEGNNEAEIHSSKTTAATQLQGGGGKDRVTFEGLSWSSASFQANLGEGDNTVSFTADKITPGSVHVVGGSGKDVFSLAGASVKTKDLKLELGEGNNTTILNAPAVSISNLDVVGGSGNDTFNATADSLTIAGTASLALGDGTNTLKITGTTTKIKGELDISQGDNGAATASKITIDDGGLFSVGKNLSIHNGTGLFETKITTGTLTVKGGVSVQQEEGTSSSSSFTVDNGTAFSIGKNLDVRNGAGKFSTSITTSTLSVAGSLTLQGEGVAGNLHNSYVTATGALTVKGNVTFIGGDGTYESGLYGGGSVKIAGKTTIKRSTPTASGRAEVYLESKGDLQLKTLEILAGASDSEVELSAAKFISSGISYTGGTGGLTLDLEANVIQTKGSISLNSSGGNEVTINSLNLAVSGDVEVPGLGNLQLSTHTGKIGGSVRSGNVIIGATKNITIGRDLEVHATEGGMLSTIARTIVKGNTSIIGGDTMTSLAVVSSQFFGTFDLTTGSDVDILSIDGGLTAGKGSQFHGPVTIETGEGSDDITIGIPDSAGAPTFHNTVTLSGGTGTNQLRIGGNVVFKKGTPDTSSWTLA